MRSITATFVDEMANSLRASELGQYCEKFVYVGEGGNGVVFRAWHKALDRPVAIKLLLPEVESTPEALARFMLEARALAKITHPNVVKVLSVGNTPDNKAFLVLEFLEGTVLSDVLRSSALSPEETRGFILDALGAVRSMHEQGLLHRDIKPDNFMVVETSPGQRRLKLFDFGLVKQLGQIDPNQQLTRSGEVCGTPLYMSPEQCCGQALDERSDIYSLGCLLYEMHTGRPPFRGANDVESMRRHVLEEPPPMHTVRKDGLVVQELESAVSIALEKMPADRFRSCKEFAEALSGVQLTSSTCVSPVPVTAAKSSIRFNRLAVGAVTIMLVLVSVGLLSFAVLKDSRRHRSTGITCFLHAKAMQNSHDERIRSNKLAIAEEYVRALAADGSDGTLTFANRVQSLRAAAELYKGIDNQKTMELVLQGLGLYDNNTQATLDTDFWALLDAIRQERICGGSRLYNDVTQRIKNIAVREQCHPSGRGALALWQAAVLLENGDRQKALELVGRTTQYPAAEEDARFALMGLSYCGLHNDNNALSQFKLISEPLKMRQPLPEAVVLSRALSEGKVSAALEEAMVGEFLLGKAFDSPEDWSRPDNVRSRDFFLENQDRKLDLLFQGLKRRGYSVEADMVRQRNLELLADIRRELNAPPGSSRFALMNYRAEHGLEASNADQAKLAISRCDDVLGKNARDHLLSRREIKYVLLRQLQAKVLEAQRPIAELVRAIPAATQCDSEDWELAKFLCAQKQPALVEERLSRCNKRKTWYAAASAICAAEARLAEGEPVKAVPDLILADMPLDFYHKNRRRFLLATAYFANGNMDLALDELKMFDRSLQSADAVRADKLAVWANAARGRLDSLEKLDVDTVHRNHMDQCLSLIRDARWAQCEECIAGISIECKAARSNNQYYWRTLGKRLQILANAMRKAGQMKFADEIESIKSVSER